MIRCNCGEMLPLHSGGPAHVCPTIDKTVSLNADSQPLVTKSYHLGANDADLTPMSNASGDDPIRDAVLTVPEDLLSLRAVLDRGHNITRSDGYALLNYIESASGDDEELKGLLDDYERQASAYGQGRRNSTTKAREALESFFGRIKEELKEKREEIIRDNSLILSYVEEVKSLRAEITRLRSQFTSEDLQWLRQMSFSSMGWEEAEAHQKWWQSFLVRISGGALKEGATQ